MYESWNNYKDYLEKKYGGTLYRVGVDGGFNCPNRDKNHFGGCSFCDGTGSVAAYQRISESGFTRFSSYEERVASSITTRYASLDKQITKGLEFVKRRYKAKECALYFQSWTNTYDSLENLKKIYDKGLSYYPFKELIISTRPDCMEEDVLSLLESYITDEREVWVEVGLQSANNDTLSRINRGHDKECYFSAVERAKKHNLKVSTHVIIGLEKENERDYENTINAVNLSMSEAIKIHNLHISGGTRLADDFLEGEVVTSSSIRHMENVAYLLRKLRKECIVQRLLCDTPMHRLLSPRFFMDKSLFLKNLNSYMAERGWKQGDLYSSN